jgi:hypothetical protein
MAWQALVEAITQYDETTFDVAIRVYDDVAPDTFKQGGVRVLAADSQAQARAKIVTAGQALQAKLQQETSSAATRLARVQQFVGTTIAL